MKVGEIAASGKCFIRGELLMLRKKILHEKWGGLPTIFAYAGMLALTTGLTSCNIPTQNQSKEQPKVRVFCCRDNESITDYMQGSDCLFTDSSDLAIQSCLSERRVVMSCQGNWMCDGSSGDRCYCPN